MGLYKETVIGLLSTFIFTLPSYASENNGCMNALNDELKDLSYGDFFHPGLLVDKIRLENLNNIYKMCAYQRNDLLKNKKQTSIKDDQQIDNGQIEGCHEFIDLHPDFGEHTKLESNLDQFNKVFLFKKNGDTNAVKVFFNNNRMVGFSKESFYYTASGERRGFRTDKFAICDMDGNIESLKSSPRGTNEATITTNLCNQIDQMKGHSEKVPSSFSGLCKERGGEAEGLINRICKCSDGNQILSKSWSDNCNSKGASTVADYLEIKFKKSGGNFYYKNAFADGPKVPNYTAWKYAFDLCEKYRGQLGSPKTGNSKEVESRNKKVMR